jgi:hypothetical protein
LKTIWRVIAITLVFLVLLSIVFFPPKKANPTTPSIGIYYYPWYMGAWETSHTDCPDAPYLGKYNSANLSVTVQHLNWFEQLGVDFIIFSWWGKDSPSDNNAKLILNQIQKNYTDIQFFILVESFDIDWSEAYNDSTKTYNYSLIYDYIYSNYISKFNSNTFNLEGKPVIGFYDGPDKIFTKNMVPSDNRFTLRIIGCQPDDDWEYEVPDPTLSNQPICRDGEISVCPRYDSYETDWHEDVDYTEGLYDAQWGKALREVKQGNAKIVTIISWNEFSERTQIEPTFDTTSAFNNNPFYLFDKTQAYIEKAKATEKRVNVCSHLSDYGCSTISHLIDLGVRYVRTDWLLNDSLMSEYSQNLQNNNINLLTIIDINTFNQITPTIEEWKKTLMEIITSEGFNNTDAVEIWNEPNAEAYIPPETYYEMLKSAYVIIKNYARIPVVFAGVSPNVQSRNWQSYLNAVFAHEDAEDYFDYMGIHLYDDMSKNLDTLQFVKNLTTKPIWLTETGKPSLEHDENGMPTAKIDEAVQADYIKSVYATFNSQVDKIFIYELKDNPDPTIEFKERHFGLLTAEGTQKEAFWTVYNINRAL